MLLRLEALVLKRETPTQNKPAIDTYTLEKHLLSHPIPKHLLDLSDKELLNSPVVFSHIACSSSAKKDQLRQKVTNPTAGLKFLLPYQWLLHPTLSPP